MTDRLPVPLVSAEEAHEVERASATPAGAPRRPSPAAAGDGEGAAPGSLPRTLSEVEGWMVRAITGTEAEARLTPDLVTDGPRMVARERLEIYRWGYRARLVECLADDYPTLAQTLGDERFEGLCDAYIERFPSSAPSLNFFGRHLARLCLETSIPGFEHRRGFLAELAKLEWSIVEVIHSEIPPPLDAATLQALGPSDWATARFEPSEAVRLLRFDHPVNAFFQASRAKGGVPAMPEPTASATVVYRHGLTVWRMDLTPAMTRVLSALLARVPIGEALATMGVDETDLEAIREAERSVMIWFREWVSSGLFAAVVRG